jgi:hypothetical protein
MSDTTPPETLTADLFATELRAALRSYERHVVCIEQVPEETESALHSLLEKAIQAFQNRAPGLKHGIALNRQVTVILSESSGAKPLCGIYFNLHSPYARKIAKTDVSSS